MGLILTLTPGPSPGGEGKQARDKKREPLAALLNGRREKHYFCGSRLRVSKEAGGHFALFYAVWLLCQGLALFIGY